MLLEPSDGQVEGGCQGTLRVELRTRGERAHSARGWMGSNAIHAASPILARLAAYEPRHPVIDGLEYREGLNAVRISGGVAGNVIPDECVVTVNFRYAPDRSEDEAIAHVRDVFADCGVEEFTVVDHSGGALPGLSHPAAAAFIEAVGAPRNPSTGGRTCPASAGWASGGQLRTREPAFGAQTGRARRHLQDPRRGGAPEGLAVLTCRRLWGTSLHGGHAGVPRP